MKKLFVAILALIYITTSTGVIIHMHYCMGKVIEWKFVSNIKNTCGNCGKVKVDGKDNGCCKDKVKLVRNNADQRNAELAFQMIHFMAIEMPLSFIEISPIDFTTVTVKNPTSHAPPMHRGVPIYMLNCLYLI